jgi:hypothetical protein
VALASIALLPSSAGAARGLELGLTDGVFQSSEPGERSLWLNRAKEARAGLVLLGASWRSIAPATRPAGFDPTDADDPAYSWGTLDDAVRDASARGFDVMILVTSAPDWAEGRNRPGPTVAAAGTWKPDPGKLRQFARAIASRYSGGFRGLPRVRRWQLWAEPNLSIYLTPQWRRNRAVAPRHYRKMLNGFYAGVNSVSRRNVVITGGTAPYGDPLAGGSRTPPARFWRTLLCLEGRGSLRPVRCPAPAHFDVAAHHPINVGAPRREAFNPDDISTPDIDKLKRIIRKAERTGRARPGGRKPIWATEIWWDSDPPDPDGVPARKHARWLAESFYLLWKQGVRTVVWFQIRDPALSGSHAETFETGLFLRDGTAKPAYRAFRFPFAAERRNERQVRVWGKAPSAGQVAIQRRRAGGWRTLERVRAGASRIFVERVTLRGSAFLRARAGGETSLSWRQR